MAILSLNLFEQIIRESIDRCYYCNQVSNELTREHIVPKYFKRKVWYPKHYNIVQVCKKCNADHALVLHCFLQYTKNHTKIKVKNILKKLNENMPFYDPSILYEIYTGNTSPFKE